MRGSPQRAPLMTRKDFDAMNEPNQPYDVTRLPQQDEIEQGIREIAPHAPSTPMSTPLPSYVEHADDTPQVGRLTAEVIVKEYETTAQAIETMANELVTMQKRIDAEAVDLHKINDELRAAAESARERGKALFEKIEQTSKLAEEIRLRTSTMTDALYKLF